MDRCQQRLWVACEKLDVRFLAPSRKAVCLPGENDKLEGALSWGGGLCRNVVSFENACGISYERALLGKPANHRLGKQNQSAEKTM